MSPPYGHIQWDQKIPKLGDLHAEAKAAANAFAAGKMDAALVFREIMKFAGWDDDLSGEAGYSIIAIVALGMAAHLTPADREKLVQRLCQVARVKPGVTTPP